MEVFDVLSSPFHNYEEAGYAQRDAQFAAEVGDVYNCTVNEYEQPLEPSFSSRKRNFEETRDDQPTKSTTIFKTDLSGRKRPEVYKKKYKNLP